MEDETPELLLIDKPKGITSFDVIRILRRKLNIKKMGHAGTLDPLASGLMLIGVASGTKKLTELTKLDKEYVAEILIGERRSTGDMAGEVVEEKMVDDSEAESLRSKLSASLQSLIGENTLPVSVYSAIKVNGVALYKRAYRGEKIEELPVRKMTVYEAEMIAFSISHGKATASIRFKVSSGTYIRSLAEEIGRQVNYPATLANLKRTKIGNFDLESAIKV